MPLKDLQKRKLYSRKWYLRVRDDPVRKAKIPAWKQNYFKRNKDRILKERKAKWAEYYQKNKDHLIAKHYEWLENNPDYYRRYNHRRYILKKNGGMHECVGLSSAQHRATANILGLKSAAKYLKGELNGNRRRSEKTATITA